MKYKRSLFFALLLVLIVSHSSGAETPKEFAPVNPVEFKPVYLIPSQRPYILHDDRAKPVATKAPVKPKPKVTPKPKPIVVAKSKFKLDRNVSWYGPGFYGRRTACGLKYTKTILGVAHKTLPCGTLVTFRNPKNGRIFTVPVIDRGPYVRGRQWDLSGGLCVKLDHCYTGSIEYRIVR